MASLPDKNLVVSAALAGSGQDTMLDLRMTAVAAILGTRSPSGQQPDPPRIFRP